MDPHSLKSPGSQDSENGYCLLKHSDLQGTLPELYPTPNFQGGIAFLLPLYKQKKSDTPRDTFIQISHILKCQRRELIVSTTEV